MKTLTFLGSLLLLAVTACQTPSENEDVSPGAARRATTGYPDVCQNTLGQAPIDIPKRVVRFISQDPRINYRPFLLSDVENTGENLRINLPETTTNNFIVVKGKRYNLRQFHFHRDSEHGIRGRKQAMELHLVHLADDGAIAVIGALIELDNDPNLALAVLFGLSPREPGSKVSNLPFNARFLLPEDPNQYYTYSGSLTTPPFTENVTWIVCKRPVRMTPAQLERYAALYPEKNARPFQPLNGRTVFEQVGNHPHENY